MTFERRTQLSTMDSFWNLLSCLLSFFFRIYRFGSLSVPCRRSNMLIQLDADITSNPLGCSQGIAKSLSPWQLGYLGISYGHLCTIRTIKACLWLQQHTSELLDDVRCADFMCDNLWTWQTLNVMSICKKSSSFLKGSKRQQSQYDGLSIYISAIHVGFVNRLLLETHPHAQREILCFRKPFSRSATCSEMSNINSTRNWSSTLY